MFLILKYVYMCAWKFTNQVKMFYTINQYSISIHVKVYTSARIATQVDFLVLKNQLFLFFYAVFRGNCNEQKYLRKTVLVSSTLEKLLNVFVNGICGSFTVFCQIISLILPLKCWKILKNDFLKVEKFILTIRIWRNFSASYTKSEFTIKYSFYCPILSKS